MKKLRLFVLLVASVAVAACDDYDDSALKSRLDALETPEEEALAISFEAEGVFYCSEDNSGLTVNLPATLKESDFVALTAVVKNEAGYGMDIATRAGDASRTWGVKVTAPTFSEGTVVPGSARVTLTLPENKTAYRALLTASLLLRDGTTCEASCLVWYKSEAYVVENAGGELSAKVSQPAGVKSLTVVGGMNEADFTFIREQMTSLELLDLSRTTLTTMPIRALAFYDAGNETLQTVILPETLQTTGEWATFGFCRALRHINLPRGLTSIVDWTFEGCYALEDIVIPPGVTYVGSGAFRECNTLTSLRFPAGVTVLSEQVAYECENLKSVEFSDQVTAIGDDAFCMSEKLTEISPLPSKLTTIGSRSFSYMPAYNGAELVIPEGVTTIGIAAFAWSDIQTIDLPSTLTSLHAAAFHWKNATLVKCRSVAVPDMPLANELGTTYDMFHDIDKTKCALQVSVGADYSAWAPYFKTISRTL